MTDTVTACHPVPVLARRRRGRPAWSLRAVRTPVELPRVAPGDVEPAGEATLGDGERRPVPIARIEGRAFVEVVAGDGTAPGESLPAALAARGGGYRNLYDAYTLLVGTPAAALPLCLDEGLMPSGSLYEDHRGEGREPGAGEEVLNDLTGRAREALRAFVARNVRLAGGRAFVDAGGPLMAPVEGNLPYLARYAPREVAGSSLVRLHPAEVEDYAAATGFRHGLRGGRPPPEAHWPAPGDGGDLMFLNAVPGTVLAAVAPFVRRARRSPGTVGPEDLAAFEALVRPAFLGAAGLLGEDDAIPVLKAVRLAAARQPLMEPPGGIRREILEDYGRHVARALADIDHWALPRARARAARFDAEDAEFLPGPGR